MELIFNSDSQRVAVDDSSPTIAVLWDRAVQEAVNNTAPGPTIASQAYSMVHTAIFNAWAAYDLTAIATQLGDDLQRPEIEVTEENKQEVISYAAYRVLEELFPFQIDIFASLMAELGFDPENRTTDTTTAAGIGNVYAQALLDCRQNDGSNQLGDDPMELILNSDSQRVTVDDSSPTISVLWGRAVQEAVNNTAPGSTIASRTYTMVYTAIFDAWAASDLTAIATQLGEDLQGSEIEVTEENKQEAISYAAYRVLEELFPFQIDIFASLMADLGYDPENRTTDTTIAAGIGNVYARALLDFPQNDGSNQLGDDSMELILNSDMTNYQPVNSPDGIRNLEYWKPEYIPMEDPNGYVQEFLTPQWGEGIPLGNL